MKRFKDVITLVRNNRGCYILDTVKGCSVCARDKPRGCYGDCYARNIASRYGMDFSTPIQRGFGSDNMQPSLFGFSDNRHETEIVKAIKGIDMPFVRIGEMGDPSEDWEHTVNVCKAISRAGKPIVIITKHWKPIPRKLLPDIGIMGICVNTSISAMDTDSEIIHRLIQHERIKEYTKAILRIVSCDFNTGTAEGERMAGIQDRLFARGRAINTVFRPSASNPLVMQGIINVKKVNFLKSRVLASVHYPDSYLGDCPHCPDMCGISA